MGGLTSALAPVLQIGSAVGTIASTAMPFIQNEMQAAQRKDSNALELKQAQQSAALQKQQLQLQAAQVESDRRSALKRAVARQKANFGGQGIGSNEGSSEAVLLGLFNESEEDRAARGRLDSLREAAINQGVNQKSQLNLLQQAQLQEKLMLSRISNFGELA